MPDASSLDRALCSWASRSGALLCVLFGSRAGDKTQVKGDLDVAVQFANLPTPERRLALLGELQDAFGEVEVDLVFLRGATDPVLRSEIFRTGRCVFEKVPGLLIEEKVRALMLLEDTVPLRRLRRERLRRIGAGPTDHVP